MTPAVSREALPPAMTHGCSRRVPPRQRGLLVGGVCDGGARHGFRGRAAEAAVAIDGPWIASPIEIGMAPAEAGGATSCRGSSRATRCDRYYDGATTRMRPAGLRAPVRRSAREQARRRYECGGVQARNRHVGVRGITAVPVIDYAPSSCSPAAASGSERLHALGSVTHGVVDDRGRPQGVAMDDVDVPARRHRLVPSRLPRLTFRAMAGAAVADASHKRGGRRQEWPAAGGLARTCFAPVVALSTCRTPASPWTVRRWSERTRGRCPRGVRTVGSGVDADVPFGPTSRWSRSQPSRSGRLVAMCRCTPARCSPVLAEGQGTAACPGIAAALLEAIRYDEDGNP